MNSLHFSVRRVAAYLLLATVLAPATSAVAQSAVGSFEDHMERGKVASATMDPEGAADHFAAALELDSLSYEANWRLAVALVDIGKQTPDDVKSKERDSLYALAEVYARRAVDIELLRPNGHYALALSIGKASLTKGNKERVARAREIRVEALKTLELDPEHDQAHHVIGMWHAEIKRLSGVQKWFAKNLFGGDFLDLASWELAVDHMERSVAIVHRFDLAEIYLDLDRPEDAKQQLLAIESLPPYDVLDPGYKRQAAVLLQEIAEEEARD